MFRFLHFLFVLMVVICVCVCVCLCVYVCDRVSLCSPAWPVTTYVDQVGLKITGISLSLSPKCWD